MPVVGLCVTISPLRCILLMLPFVWRQLPNNTEVFLRPKFVTNRSSFRGSGSVHTEMNRNTSSKFSWPQNGKQAQYSGDRRLLSVIIYRVIQNDYRGFNNLSYTIQLFFQMQPHVISFYGVTSRIRFMFLLFPQVSRNWRLLHASNNLERTRLSCWCLYNHKGCTYRAPVRYVTKTWSVVLLNKK